MRPISGRWVEGSLRVTHKSLSEALHEAALGADKIAIDFPNR